MASSSFTIQQNVQHKVGRLRPKPAVTSRHKELGNTNVLGKETPAVRQKKTGLLKQFLGLYEGLSRSDKNKELLATNN